MTSPNAQRSQHAALSAALFRAWVARVKPGERLEYHRGFLATDRITGTSSLKEAERRWLDAVADHALLLAAREELHLVQQRHGNSDYSYIAVKASERAPAKERRGRNALLRTVTPPLHRS